ncbi:hypothetical protein CLV63_12416 [Murinocardiopsis flavida]|uniref:Helix-turn-helix domain-containing protein n=1 Tax=Murinocardiopsis flavida TaxID=645275 RepID=A0A2P8CY71_9ACTN|nr:helix-turn-helix domain-containing protein [Murinocardiopsis flavida]PSK89912.1 hypothetical protein CLV63_12416 [Murinocardiopsis flavida]
MTHTSPTAPAAIARLYQDQELRVVDIAARTELSDGQIRAILTDQGIALRRRTTSRVPPEDRPSPADLVTAYDQGASIRTLTQRTGMSYGYIHRALVGAGVRFRVRGGQRPRAVGVRR